MANRNAPFGFRPTMRTFAGASGSISPAHKLSAAAAIYVNDAITVAANGTQTTRCIAIASGPGTAAVLGVNLIYGATGGGDTQHAIVLAKDAVFVAQGDGSGAAFLVLASLGLNGNIVFTTGDTGTKMSKQSLNETGLAGTNTLDLKVRGLYRAPDNAAGQYARVCVSFNNCVDSDQKAQA